MKDYTYAVVIGRFQPLHSSHVKLIEKALDIAENVIVIIGSAQTAPNIKNPFSFEQRKQMFNDCFPEYLPLPDGQPAHHSTQYTGRLKIEGVRDYFYSNNVWVANVQAVVAKHVQEGDSVALVGYYKDESSWYLKMFPQWEFVPYAGSDMQLMSGSCIRCLYFDVIDTTPSMKSSLLDRSRRCPQDWKGKATISHEIIGKIDKRLEKMVPENVLEFLRSFRKTQEFVRLVEEYDAVQQYKRAWKDAPYDPTFVTADAVVVCSGHVLVVKRGFNPGRGLYALPGGFVRQKEDIRQAALRELKEETRIRVEKIILESSIVDSRVFDHPDRSLRGRTITHAFHLRLKDGKLPEVASTGGDDADGAFWMPLMDVAKYENRFFEDHVHIINYFVNNSR